MTNRTVPVKKYHTTLLDTIRDINLQNKWFAAPINLGGVTGEDGGSGIPIGGLIGQLIQSKVAYDTTEASTLFTPVSGASLVDNLNHIRYWIDTVSGGGGSSTFLDLTDVDESSYTGFEGYSVVVNTGEDGLEFVNVSGGGGTDTKKVMVSSDDTTEGYLEDKLYGGNFVTITTITPGGNEQSRIAVAMSLDDLENVTFTDLEEGQSVVYEGLGEWINATISGGGEAYTFVYDDVTSQIPAAGDNYTTAATPASGSLVVNLNGLTQQPNNYSISGVGFHTLFTATSGDELTASYYTDVPTGNILALTLDVEDDSTPVASNVEVLNFEGMDVSVDGSTVTISGGTGSGGGGDVAVDDEGIEITSAVTSLNFVGPSVVATNTGDDVTVTISGAVVDMPSFVGTRLYKSTNQTVLDDSSWHEVSWSDEVYDEGGLHTGTNDYIEIPSNEYGYYRFTGSITFSGVQPTAGIYQLAIFKDWTGVASMFTGNYATTSGIYTLVTTADYYCNDASDYRLRYICNDSTADATIMSGVANSYFSAHKIQAAIADLSDTPKCCRIYNNGYDTDPLDQTWTDADFTNEDYDTNTFFTYASSHYKFTFHDAGYYNVVCKIQSPGNPSSIFNMSSRCLLNDTDVIAQVWDKIMDASNYNQGRTLLIEFDYYFEEDDYIEFQVWQDSGGQVTDFIKPDSSGADSYVAIHQIYGD